MEYVPRLRNSVKDITEKFEQKSFDDDSPNSNRKSYEKPPEKRVKHVSFEDGSSPPHSHSGVTLEKDGSVFKADDDNDDDDDDDDEVLPVEVEEQMSMVDMVEYYTEPDYKIEVVQRDDFVDMTLDSRVAPQEYNYTESCQVVAPKEYANLQQVQTVKLVKRKEAQNDVVAEPLSSRVAPREYYMDEPCRAVVAPQEYDELDSVLEEWQSVQRPDDVVLRPLKSPPREYHMDEPCRAVVAPQEYNEEIQWVQRQDDVVPEPLGSRVAPREYIGEVSGQEVAPQEYAVLEKFEDVQLVQHPDDVVPEPLSSRVAPREYFKEQPCRAVVAPQEYDDVDDVPRQPLKSRVAPREYFTEPCRSVAAPQEYDNVEEGRRKLTPQDEEVVVAPTEYEDQSEPEFVIAVPMNRVTEPEWKYIHVPEVEPEMCVAAEIEYQEPTITQTIGIVKQVAPKKDYQEHDSGIESRADALSVVDTPPEYQVVDMHCKQMMSASVAAPSVMAPEMPKMIPIDNEQQRQNLMDVISKIVKNVVPGSDDDSIRADLDFFQALKDMNFGYYRYSQNASKEDLISFGRTAIDRKVLNVLMSLIISLEPYLWYNTDSVSLNNVTMQFDRVIRTIRNALDFMFNLSDASEEVTSYICYHPEYIYTVVGNIGSYNAMLTDDKEIAHRLEKYINHCLGLIHNIARVDANKERIRQLNLPPLMFKLIDLEGPTNEQRLSAMLILADILTDEENKQLVAKSDGINCLMTQLDAACRDGRLMSNGWSAVELTASVSKLALNADNTKVMVGRDILKLLTDLLGLVPKSDIIVVANALFALSFEKQTKQKMIAEPRLISKLQELLTTGKDDVKVVVKRILWNLRYSLRSSPQYRELADQFCGVEGAKKSSGRKHIMLSYNWAHQDIMLQVRNTLNGLGYKTWMDVDNMEGSTLESMAGAVENSAAIVVGMTQKYRESKFCRLEFEYGFKCDKQLIPLKLQKRYNPDSWLGLVINNQLYYDLTHPDVFMEKIDGVVKAIGKPEAIDAKLHKEDDDEDFPDFPSIDADKFITPTNATLVSTLPPPVIKPAQPVIPPSKPVVNAPGDIGGVKGWNSDKVGEWLKAYSLNNTPAMSGQHLVFLMKIKAQAPEYFYHLVDKHCKLGSLTEVMTFHNALDDLFF